MLAAVRARVPPHELVQLTKAQRLTIRRVPRLLICSEQRIVRYRLALAATHGTATATFSYTAAGKAVYGAYLTDPLTFLTHLQQHSSFLVIGGDAGGGSCKIGVTYLTQSGKLDFAALLIVSGADKHSDLLQLTSPNLTPFSGLTAQSPALTNIFLILQFLLCCFPSSTFLNGDWLFINAISGYQTASASYPCSICIVFKDTLLTPSAPRRPSSELNSAFSKPNTPLFLIDPSRIVPTPLHLFLGICNRIIRHFYPLIFGAEAVAEAMASVKSVHSYSPGAAGVHDLNGVELASWLRLDLCSSLLFSARTFASQDVPLLSSWMRGLRDHLLHKSPWSPSQLSSFSSLVYDMQHYWQHVTDSPPFPKLHMFSHALSFAKQHGALGLYSEAQIECYHARFNSLYLHTHRNLGKGIAERYRRSLADLAVEAIATGAADSANS